MNETIKSITLQLSAGKRDARLSQLRAPAPSIDGGKSRHGVRPREIRPEQPAEQNRRRGGRRRSRSKPPRGTSTKRRDRGQSSALCPPKDLIKRDDFSFAFYEPYLEFLCLLHS